MTIKEKNERIARTIIEQMGGFNKLGAMIALSHTLILDSGVSFRFKGSRKANYCKIILEATDLYTVEFYKVRELINVSVNEPLKSITGVYNDMLKPIFEETTGLYLSL
jgi:hypothetical protein